MNKLIKFLFNFIQI